MIFLVKPCHPDGITLLNKPAIVSLRNVEILWQLWVGYGKIDWIKKHIVSGGGECGGKLTGGDDTGNLY